MNSSLEKEILIAGHKNTASVSVSTETDQDFLIMSKLLKVTKTIDFDADELEYYNWISENIDAPPLCRGKIQTPDFTEEELKEYQWAAEHPTGSCRGFCLTDEPTEEEVKDWQASLEFFNKMDFKAVRARVEFYDREEIKTYDSDPEYPSFFSDRTTEYAACNLGRDPYSQHDGGW